MLEKAVVQAKGNEPQCFVSSQESSKPSFLCENKELTGKTIPTQQVTLGHKVGTNWFGFVICRGFPQVRFTHQPTLFYTPLAITVSQFDLRAASMLPVKGSDPTFRVITFVSRL